MEALLSWKDKDTYEEKERERRYLYIIFYISNVIF